MSEKLPALKSADLVRIVETKGFEKVRQSGSHAIYRHSNGRRTTIPIHSGKQLVKDC